MCILVQYSVYEVGWEDFGVDRIVIIGNDGLNKSQREIEFIGKWGYHLPFVSYPKYFVQLLFKDTS